MRSRFAAILIPLSLVSVQAHAQGTSASSSARSAQLALLFNKSKHVVKERRGVRREKFADVKNVPVARSNPATYSGTYDADFGYVLHLTVQPDGRILGSGEEPVGSDSRISRTFVLEKARIDGALLRGTRVYRDGRREQLEGVFIDRTTRSAPTDPGLTTFGLGVIIQPTQVSGLNLERLFYRLRDR